MGRHARAARSERRWAVAGLAVSMAVLIVGGAGLAEVWHRSGETASVAASASAPLDSPPPIPGPSASSPASMPSAPQTSASVPAVHPIALQIPSIAVDTSLEQLGVAADGTLQTPADPRHAGWFTGSAVPGEPGPVVVAGHVDSRSGPAVFAHLKKLKAGASITVTLGGGKRVAYRVTSVVAYAKDKFPTQAVYGAVPDSELRLITCGGAFVDGEYVDDVIVFAAPST
jgi:LPXTG-site transpeptidase (sortase) family protein